MDVSDNGKASGTWREARFTLHGEEEDEGDKES